MSAPAIINRRSRRTWSLRSYAYRTPLTLTMMIVTTISAIASGALDGGTPSSVVERFGYSLDNLKAGHIWVFITSDWIVNNPRHWSSMLLLFALFCFPLEAIGGTKLLAAAFWTGSWGGTILTSLLVRWLRAPLAWTPHPDLVHQADVGGSVGTWSAAGALHVLVWRQPGWLLWPARLGAAAYILLRLATAGGSPDVAHLIGFLIGTAIGLWHARR